MSMNEWTALLVLWGVGLLCVALPIALSTFAVFSAARRRLGKLLVLQVVLCVALLAFFRTPIYSQHAVSLLVPPAIALLQLAMRKYWR